MARTDFFLKLDGIKGESTDATHAGEIDVESFSWGETNVTTIGSATGGAGAGRVKFDQLIITTRVSSASPQIAGMCAAGQHFPTGTLTVRKAGGKQEDYYKVNFKLLFITKYRSVAAVGTDVIPRDEITFEFGEYSIEYRPQTKDGSLGSAVITGWNQIRNTRV